MKMLEQVNEGVSALSYNGIKACSITNSVILWVGIFSVKSLLGRLG